VPGPNSVQLDEQLLSPAFFTDPYAVHRRLRAEAPVHWCEPWNCWIISRYDDVTAGLRQDGRQFSVVGQFGSYLNALPEADRPRFEPLKQHFSIGLLHSDPPDHTRLRGLINQAFTPRVVERMRGRIEATVNALLDAVEGDGGMDVIQDFAFHLPAIITAEVVGMPPEDRHQFKAWSDDLARALEPFLSREQQEKVYRADERFAAYFAGIIEQRRREPRDDLVSRLVEAAHSGDKLTADETWVMPRLLRAAANETTTHLTGHGGRARLRPPDQLALLSERPELVPSAVEELLRYDAPVQLDMRVALRDTELGGLAVSKGTLITLLIGSANHDPERFPEPEALDITRSDHPNISFGRGIHHCLGAPLARLEGRIALEVLLERFPRLGFGTRPPKYRPSIVLRGLEHLDVRVG